MFWLPNAHGLLIWIVVAEFLRIIDLSFASVSRFLIAEWLAAVQKSAYMRAVSLSDCLKGIFSTTMLAKVAFGLPLAFWTYSKRQGWDMLGCSGVEIVQMVADFAICRVGLRCQHQFTPETCGVSDDPMAEPISVESQL